MPSSGFVRELPTTSPALGSIPVAREYTGLDEDAGHRVDGSFRVTGVAISSSPANGDAYRAREEIEVTMFFSADAYTSGSVVAIRVGDSAPDNYRAARYVSGSGTDELIYRYRVQLSDYDADDGFAPIISITDVDVDGGSEPGGVGFAVTLTGPGDHDIAVDWGISDSAADPAPTTWPAAPSPFRPARRPERSAYRSRMRSTNPNAPSASP